MMCNIFSSIKVRKQNVSGVLRIFLLEKVGECCTLVHLN